MNTPDTTKAQLAALVQAILAVLIAFGLHLTSAQQTALLALSGTVFTTLVLADAIIRHGRARALTPPPAVIDLSPARRTTEPLTPPAPGPVPTPAPVQVTATPAQFPMPTTAAPAAVPAA